VASSHLGANAASRRLPPPGLDAKCRTNPPVSLEACWAISVSGTETRSWSGFSTNVILSFPQLWHNRAIFDWI